ncbi:MAG: 30S ribosomal protein S20 [Clostridia bacterium]|nr:30S ribosomal protein S20 [Clostridia bacterium]MCL6522034.1 30S ribosomal protein S20 [Bacillota bacterium]
MANIKSAKKRIELARKATLRNKAGRSRARTAIRRFREALATGDRAQVEAKLREAVSVLDRVARKGILHPNAAARRKSRMTREFNEFLQQRGGAS